MPFSDFRRRLRLPRLFFRKPTEAERIHGGPPFEIERPIPQLSWRWISIAVALVVAAALLIWELHCRSIGYSPSLNDNDDLWSLTRRKVKPDSLLLIGDSTGWFDLDLDELDGVSKEQIAELLAVKPDEWKTELEGQAKFFETLKPDMPERLLAEREKVAKRFGS